MPRKRRTGLSRLGRYLDGTWGRVAFLGLIATAEGVETIDQLRAVRELGCDVVQGYLISPPLDPAALNGWIEKFRRTWPAMIAEGERPLWGDVETNALGER